MSATEHLSGEQFKAYRGLYLGDLQKRTFVPPGPGPKSGIGHFEYEQTDPHDAEAVIKNHLRQLPEEDRTSPYKENWPVYGHNWTPHEDMAMRFAHDPTHARRYPAARGDNPSYGIVLEAHTSEPVTVSHDNFERHLNVPRRIINSVTAHLYHDPGRGGNTGSPSTWKAQNHVQSFVVPQEHWRHA